MIPMQIFAPKRGKRKNPVRRLLTMTLLMVGLVAVLAQTAVAQNTYVITDGDQITVHTSFSSDPAIVLDQAGVELDGNDFYTTAAGDGVSEITVQREQTIHIDYCGRKIQASSYGESLQTLVDRLGLQTYGTYSVSEDLKTMTYDGMEVYINNVVQAQETYTVEVPFETIYCSDPTLPEGEEEVLVEGVVGQIQRQAQVVYKNAQEQSRIVLEETLLEQPVNKIVAVGTGTNVGEKSDMPLIGDGVIVLQTGEVLTYTSSKTFKATAYTHTDAGCDRITATGTRVRVGTVAVDPRVIPYGTRMFIVTNDGSYIYGIATAEDCGGAIKENRIDLYFETTSECFKFGRRTCTVYFLGDAQGIFW